MRKQWIALLAVLALFFVACDGDDPELSTDSTIISGSTTVPTTGGGSTTTTPDGEGTSPPTTLAGEQVSDYQVVTEIENDNGVEQHIVIPHGAYTDVDLENFAIDLIEENPDLHGAQIFDDVAAAEAFLVPQEERTEAEQELLEEHWFVTLTGRARIDFRGPFAEFTGGAIGS